MHRGMVCVVVIAVLSLGLIGCGKKEPAAQQGAPRQGAMQPTAQPAPSASEDMANTKANLITSTTGMIDALEKQMQALQTAAEAKGAQAKADYEAMKPELESRLADAKAALKTLSDAGADTWMGAKDKLNKALSDLQGTYMKARAKFMPAPAPAAGSM